MALTFSQSDGPSCSESWCSESWRLWPDFDGDGCATLTGSDAGKVSIRPVSNRACIFWSAIEASPGSAVCLSCAAGLNFSAMSTLHGRTTSERSRRSPANRPPTARAGGAVDFSPRVQYRADRNLQLRLDG